MPSSILFLSAWSFHATCALTMFSMSPKWSQLFTLHLSATHSLGQQVYCILSPASWVAVAMVTSTWWTGTGTALRNGPGCPSRTFWTNTQCRSSVNSIRRSVGRQEAPVEIFEILVVFALPSLPSLLCPDLLCKVQPRLSCHCPVFGAHSLLPLLAPCWSAQPKSH